MSSPPLTMIVFREKLENYHFWKKLENMMKKDSIIANIYYCQESLVQGRLGERNAQS